MTSFCAALNCSNGADREKNKSNYHFPSIVENNGKEGLKRSKVRRGKWLAQSFSEDLTKKKLERTRIKIMLSASPSSAFHTKFTTSDLKNKYVFYRN